MNRYGSNRKVAYIVSGVIAVMIIAIFIIFLTTFLKHQSEFDKRWDKQQEEADKRWDDAQKSHDEFRRKHFGNDW